MDNMETFVLLYFRQKHFNSMPAAVRAQFDDYIAKNDFRGKEMRAWRDNLMHPENGKLVQNDEPDISILTEDQQDELYLALQNVFQNMSANKTQFLDNDDAIKFVDEYFGDNRLFSLPVIDRAVQTQITGLLNAIQDNKISALLTDLSRADIAELNHLLSDSERINKSQKARDILYSVVKVLLNASVYNDNEEVRNTLSALGLNDIKNALEAEIKVTQNDRDKLKTEYKKIFNTLHDKNKIYKVFKDNDQNRQISSQIDKAIKSTDYTGEINKDTYVPRKYTDKLSFTEKIQKTVEDTYNDVLKKYVTAHRDHIYIKPQAKTIMAALDKQKIKPTDGLDALITKTADIAKGLKDKYPLNSEKHFEWLSKKLEFYKNGMPHTFKNALRNGKQMNHLVEQLIIEAVEESKSDSSAIDKAKTALEVLSVMQYGTFTSKTMDAINQTDMTLFSDSKLSWNKNEGIKFVTGALDKTIKFGIQATGYAITGLANTINRRGVSFNRKGNLENKIQEEKNKLNQDHTNFLNEITKKNRDDKTEIANNTARLNTLAAKGIDAKSLQSKEAQLTTDRATEQTLQTEYTNAQQKFNNKQQKLNDLQAVEEDYRKYLQLQQNRVAQDTEVKRIETRLRALPGNPANQLEAQEAEEERQEYAKAKEDLKKIEDDMSALDNKYRSGHYSFGIIGEYNKITTPKAAGKKSDLDIAKDEFNAAKADQDTKEQSYNKQKTDNDDLEKDINEYKDKTQANIELNDQIKSRNESANKWQEEHQNLYLELMAHWDFLQTGNTKNLFHLSTKKLQADMDKNDHARMSQMYNNWRNANGYTA